MKRSRPEYIASAVTNYLKRRQYVDASSDSIKKDQRSVCDVGELVLACTVLNNGSSAAAVSYSSCSNDPSTWDQQFTRLKSFVEDSIEPYHTELQNILYPIFVHIYFEMLIAGHKTYAYKFCERHLSTFSELEEAQTMLSILPNLSSKEDINSNKLTLEFRAHRYAVTMTEGALHYLMKYLKHDNNLLILQVVNHQLEITVSSQTLTSDDADHPEESHTEPTDVDKNASSPHPPDVKTSDVTLSALRRVIQKIEEGPPPLPSVCLYTVLNGYQNLCSITLSNDEEKLCAGFEDSRLMVWSLTPKPLPCNRSDGELNFGYIPFDGESRETALQRLSASGLHDGEASATESITLRSHSGAIYSTCFLHNSPLLLSASADKTVRLWDIAKRCNVVSYMGHNYPVFCVDSSRAAPLFASCSFDQTAKLWSTDRIFPLRTFIGHTRSVNCVRFHANGNYLATCSSDSTVRLWTLQDGQPVRLMFGHHGMVMALAFSPNGKYLASAGEDQCVKIWDLATGSLFADFRGHTDFIHSLAFSHDSSLLASGGLDGNVRLWQVMKHVDEAANPGEVAVSPALLGAFPTKSVSVLSVQFSKWNYLVACGS